MKRRALVVEDDADVVEQVEDWLCSMGHEYRWVTTQQDARTALETEDFDYVLLDLEIPAKSLRGRPSKEFGANVLTDIRRIKRDARPPVIVMSGHVGFCLNHCNDLIRRGATQFITKPFPTEDRTLATVISEVLAMREQTPARPTKQPKSRQSERFAGGELALFDDRAELLGVPIITAAGTGRSMGVLRRLARRDPQGRYVRLSGEELARAIGAPGGLSTITGCIRLLRRNMTQRLARRKGMTVGPDEVIAHDEQGYYLRDWVVVRDGMSERDPGEAGNVTACGHRLNERQVWILNQLRLGTKVTRAMVEEQFAVADKTAKRDLVALRRQGAITFVRDGRSGYYRLV